MEWFVAVPFGVVISLSFTFPSRVRLQTRLVSMLSVAVQVKFTVEDEYVLFGGKFRAIAGSSESVLVSAR